MQMRKRVLAGVAMLAGVMIGSSVVAQGLSELDRALAKPDPSGELLAGFNELASATTNIAPPSASADQDRAKAADVRAALQDPAGIALARDPAQRANADAEGGDPERADLADQHGVENERAAPDGPQQNNPEPVATNHEGLLEGGEAMPVRNKGRTDFDNEADQYW